MLLRLTTLIVKEEMGRRKKGTTCNSPDLSNQVAAAWQHFKAPHPCSSFAVLLCFPFYFLVALLETGLLLLLLLLPLGAGARSRSGLPRHNSLRMG
jgi:hypothetical protein